MARRIKRTGKPKRSLFQSSTNKSRFEPLEPRVLLSTSPTVQLSLDVTPSVSSTGTPQHLSPAMIKEAYDLNNLNFSVNGKAVSADGAGETIAIVDAFADPNIASDLQTFDANFGISNNNASGQFVLTVDTPQGPVATDAGWATEESLDVEWAHAIAPEANILLVEAPSASVDSLASAVVWAASQPGVVAVSMSWGDSPEFAGETSFDSDFTTPSGHVGVTFVAASGDDGQPNYPSTSANVLAVGGTTLDVNGNGTWQGESPWADSGGGMSPYEGTNKPDVAYDGDPNTGFLIYDSTASNGEVGWQDVGGTSAGSPQWAAIIAIADQGRELKGLGSLDGATQTIPDLYNLPSADFNPISGFGLTGLGSPVGAAVISGLSGATVTNASPSQLAFAQQPANTSVGSDISPAITVDVEDSSGDIVTSDNSTVTLSLASGSGTLLGTVTATAVNGVATFSNVALDSSGSYSLDATDGSLTSATSKSFTVSAPKLAFVELPTNAVAGETLSSVEVAVENANGTVITSDNSTVTLSLASGSGTLNGTLTATAVHGIATFSNLTLSATGTDSLKATDGSDTSATSNTFAVTAPMLVFMQEPSDSIAGFSFTPAIEVAIENHAGDVITSDNSTTITLSLAGASGTLGGTLTVTAVNGVATFENVSIESVGTYSLVATSNSGASTTSSAVTTSAPGNVDLTNWDQIEGWAFDPTNPTASINVEIQIDNGPTETILANNTRNDLSSYIGTADHGFDYAVPIISAGSHTVNVYAIETNGTKYLIGTDTIVSQNSLFDEHYYLQTNPDVAAAVNEGIFATGYDHYVQYGQHEGRSPSLYWNEAYYLKENPDVAAAVKSGAVSSGFMQFYLYGQWENRPGVLYFNTDYYLANNSDVAAADKAGVISPFEHFILYGQYEGRSPMLYYSDGVYENVNPSIVSESDGYAYSSPFEQFVQQGQYEGLVASDYYNEKTYLADNPDVATAVRHGEFADGFIHWLEYGQYEGRTAV